MISNPAFGGSEFLITIIVISSFVAVTYKRWTGLTPGGIVPVGATIILAIRNPYWSLFCICLSFVGYWLYLLFIARLDKRGGFPHVYSIGLLTMIIGLAFAYLFQLLGIINIESMTIGGLIVPAILANQYRIQGYMSTIVGFLASVLISLVIILSIVLISTLLGAQESLFSYFQIMHIPEQSRHLQFYPIASLFSLLFGFIVYRKNSIRSGGYIMAPLAAQLLTSANSATILVVGLIVLYGAQLFLSQYTFIIGLQRYLATIFMSSIFVWLSIMLAQQYLSIQDAQFFGSAWIIVLVLASYSTDCYVYRRKKAGFYIVLNTIASYSLILLSKSIVAA